MSFKESKTKQEQLEILVILAHPDQNSFNHAIAETAVEQLKKNGHRVIFHDLYAEGFDPILPGPEIASDCFLPDDIQMHCNDLKRADGIIIFHPNWWGQPPAILKGWVDRVIRPNVAYKFLEGDNGEGVPIGLLKARSVIVLNTANTPEPREREVFGDPLQLIWKNCIFDLCGVPDFHREMFRVIITSTEDIRKKWLKRVEEIISNVFPALI
ncbi:MAG: NAD(P)H-dependent oxidoreductase [Deltaproteobacteria bacterium]|nr:NAD(P)H-dependent oxidoreductase [Deltaproteobacteria bacterium]